MKSPALDARGGKQSEMDTSKIKTGTESASSGKERNNEKTYRIPISTGLLEHCPKMLDSVWLYMWYIDRTTEERDGEGYILGGIPIVDAKPASALRVPVKTIRRWRLKLVREGYVRALRTPYGFVITLLKSKKRNWKPTLVAPLETDSSGRRDLPNGEITRKESSRSGHRDLPNGEERFTVSGAVISPNGKYKEDRTVLNRDRTVEEAAATSPSREELPSAETNYIPSNPGAWKEVGLPGPAGSLTFRNGWEAWYAENDSEHDSKVWLMESYIQDCQARHINVPPPFFAAKRKAEQEEQEPRVARAGQRPPVQI
jgi:hypothetical protein